MFQIVKNEPIQPVSIVENKVAKSAKKQNEINTEVIQNLQNIKFKAYSNDGKYFNISRYVIFDLIISRSV